MSPKESEQGSRVFAFIHSPPGDYFPGKMEKCEQIVENNEDIL